MEIKNAKIVQIGEVKEFANDFKVVEFVVETNDQYPQFITLQCIKEKADNLLKFNKVGDVVDCSINLRGRKWVNPEGETKYFNSIEAWKVFKADSLEKAAETIDKVFEPAGDLNEEENNDLPF